MGHNRGTSEQKKARHGSRRAGQWPVQLRFACELTGDEYVSQGAWQKASLPRCPLHPKGGCGFARHDTYARVTPPGTQIARWYCPTGHRTFSLLPDCLAARLKGTLAEVEAVVRAAEQARISPARGPHACDDPPVDPGPDWEALAQPSPEYVFDQEVQWRPPSFAATRQRRAPPCTQAPANHPSRPLRPLRDGSPLPPRPSPSTPSQGLPGPFGRC